MAIDPTVEEQHQLAETRRRQLEALAPRELRAELIVAVLFAAMTAGLWLVRAPVVTDWASLIICLLITVLAMQVRFLTPFGFTVATQLAFVPLAFVTPPALLPLAVMLAYVLSRMPAVILGRLPASKLLSAASNSCFALGPAWVFGLAGPARHAGPLILIAALFAQYVVDSGVSVVYNRVVHGATIGSQLGEIWWVWGLDGALSAVALVVAEQTLRAPIAACAVVPLLGVLAIFAQERVGRLDKLLELNETYRGTALLLGDVVEADDAYTARHSQGVVDLAVAVGSALGLHAERRRDLEFAAMLHDVGKIAIPKAIINKPGGLDAAEWELVKTHAEEGQRMLARVGGFMSRVGAIVRSHHERWDGGGYPDGLLADATPLEARIITACDSWSAMRTDRPYRHAMSFEAAVAELQANVGTQFDPVVVEALLDVVGQIEPPDEGPAPRRDEPADLAIPDDVAAGPATDDVAVAPLPTGV